MTGVSWGAGKWVMLGQATPRLPAGVLRQAPCRLPLLLLPFFSCRRRLDRGGLRRHPAGLPGAGKALLLLPAFWSCCCLSATGAAVLSPPHPPHPAHFCLPQDSAAARQQAAALLPGRSLEPVVAAVERCLHFYVTAGGGGSSVGAAVTREGSQFGGS